MAGSAGKKAGEWQGSKYIGPATAAAPASQSGDWFSQNGIQTQPPGQSPAIEGYDAAKLADPSLGTSAKYQIGRYLQAHPGDYAGAASSVGWTYSGKGDKITSPEGSVYDLARDSTGSNGQPGANVQQFQYISGGPAGTRNDGIKGNDPNSANYTKPGGLGYTGSAAAPAGTAGAMAGGQLSTLGGQASSYPTGPAPTVTQFQPPSQSPGAFAPSSSYGSQTPFSYSQNVPTPDRLNAPADAQYNNFDLPPGFKAPTAEEASQDPGYQFRLKQGLDAIQNSAAGKGILNTGNTLKGLSDYGQESASQEYQNVYGRRLGESQTAYNQGFQTNQANNQGNLAVQQANANTGLSYGTANNAAALAAQQAGYGQAANTYAQNQAGQAQEYGQQSNTYGQNLQGQNQGYQQAYNANALNNQQNLASGLGYGNLALGQGNLNLGYTQAGNSYALGQGQLALGNLQANNQNAYQQGQLGLAGNNQTFNQGLALNQNAWGQQYQLANLGNPGAPNSQGYGVDQGSVYGQQGNANAAGTIGQGNAWSTGLNNLSNIAGHYQPGYSNYYNTTGPQQPVLVAG